MSPVSPTEPTRTNLERRLDRFGLFALAFGSMIGVGWVTAIGSWLTSAGPVGAILAFGVGGVVMLCIGLCYAEVTPMLPVAGGEVAYAYKAFGTGKAFLVGWFLAFGYISVSAFEAISIGRVVSFMIPGIDVGLLYRIDGDPVYLSHLILAVLFTGLITVINYVGVGVAAAFQKWLIGAFAVVTIIFIAAGIAGGALTNLQPAFASGGTGTILSGIAVVLVTVPFWFVGFDTIPQGAEEAEASVPPRKLGTLILTAIVASTVFYMVLILSVSMTGPWQAIVSADLPTARAFEFAFGSQVLVNLVLVAALIGLLTSWNGFFLAGSRVLFALGRGRIISDRLGATHSRFHTPHQAVLLVGLITIAAPFLGRNALLAFVNVGSFCIGIAFLGVSLTVTRLRTLYPNLARPYRIPAGVLVPSLAVTGSALILAVMVIPGSPAALAWPMEVIIISAFSTLGLIFWIVGRRQREQMDESQRAFLILESYATEGA